MTEKQGSVAPKERINIKYVPATGNQQAEIELPLKLVVVGDFKGHREPEALEERRAVGIDKSSFDAVLEKSALALTLDVPARLNHDATTDATLRVDLRFGAMADFGPDAIARQVPELSRLLELREALVALKGPLGNIPAFRHTLQELLADDGARARLAGELGLVLDRSPV